MILFQSNSAITFAFSQSFSLTVHVCMGANDIGVHCNNLIALIVQWKIYEISFITALWSSCLFYRLRNRFHISLMEDVWLLEEGAFLLKLQGERPALSCLLPAGSLQAACRKLHQSLLFKHGKLTIASNYQRVKKKHSYQRQSPRNILSWSCIWQITNSLTLDRCHCLLLSHSKVTTRCLILPKTVTIMRSCWWQYM